MARPRGNAQRQPATKAEHALWQCLRLKQIHNARFRQQFPIGPYVVDFVCLPARLVVEVDCGQHAKNVAKDSARTRYLSEQGFCVVRFWNNEVLANCDGVVETIRRHIAERLRHLPPTPSRRGRGSE